MGGSSGVAAPTQLSRNQRRSYSKEVSSSWRVLQGTSCQEKSIPRTRRPLVPHISCVRRCSKLKHGQGQAFGVVTPINRVSFPSSARKCTRRNVDLRTVCIHRLSKVEHEAPSLARLSQNTSVFLKFPSPLLCLSYRASPAPSLS